MAAHQKIIISIMVAHHTHLLKICWSLSDLKLSLNELMWSPLDAFVSKKVDFFNKMKKVLRSQKKNFEAYRLRNTDLNVSEPSKVLFVVEMSKQ